MSKERIDELLHTIVRDGWELIELLRCEGADSLVGQLAVECGDLEDALDEADEAIAEGRDEIAVSSLAAVLLAINSLEVGE